MKKPHHYNNAYRDTLRDKINSLNEPVFSRNDLTTDHSNKEQLKLNRAINAFIDEGIIVKIAHGLFAKAEKMHFAQGEVKVVLTDTFEATAMQALNKLGVKWELGRAIRDYNEGRTTQVPLTFTVQLKSRFRGIIRAEGRQVIFEDGINAR